MNQKIAIIRVRGVTGVQYNIERAMKMLNLHRKNYCVIVDKIPATMGAIKKANNFITYGEIDDETMKLLETKKISSRNFRGDQEPKVLDKKTEKTKDKGGKEITKPFFRLNPPKKGFGSKGIKIGFSTGGALGYRGSAINELIRRML